jgi:tRNA uridine 5-carboxymethylaminomethyl modification enzyme
VTDTKLGGDHLSQLLKRPDFGIHDIPEDIKRVAPLEIWELAETDLKYEGYASRQTEQNRKLAEGNALGIPDGLDYLRIAGLRSETRQKLAALRPASLGEAARISGITPTDIAIISIWLKKNSLKSQKTS